MRRSFSRRMMASSAARVAFGSAPRSASLAPSSRITASVPSADRPVEPRQPARRRCRRTRRHSRSSTAMPLAFSARSSLAGSASGAASPKPAVSESPSTTIRTGRSAACAGRPSTSAATNAETRKRHDAPAGPLDPDRPGFPYDRPASAGPRLRNERPHERHLDWLDAPAIALSGVNLSLGRGAARVHILKDIDLHIGTGEAVGLVGPSGSGKSTLLMVVAGLERPDTGAVHVAGRGSRPRSTRTRSRAFAAAMSASCSSRST